MPLEQLTAQIMAAYVANNQLPADQLPKLVREILDVFLGMNGNGKAAPPVITLTEAPIKVLNNPAASTEPNPAPVVKIADSVKPDRVTCLECGWTGSMLRGHLVAYHGGMTREDYRQKWGLPPTHPLVAPAYSAKRSKLTANMNKNRGKRGGKRLAKRGASS